MSYHDLLFNGRSSDLTQIEMRLGRLEAAVESIFDCIKQWDGTGFTARDKLINKADVKQPEVVKKPKRRIEV